MQWTEPLTTKILTHRFHYGKASFSSNYQYICGSWLLIKWIVFVTVALFLGVLNKCLANTANESLRVFYLDLHPERICLQLTSLSDWMWMMMPRALQIPNLPWIGYMRASSHVCVCLIDMCVCAWNTHTHIHIGTCFALKGMYHHLYSQKLLWHSNPDLLNHLGEAKSLL